MAPPPIADADLSYVILGAFRAISSTFDAFPIKVREVRDNLDDNGIIESLTIVTDSGLMFRVNVDFEGRDT